MSQLKYEAKRIGLQGHDSNVMQYGELHEHIKENVSGIDSGFSDSYCTGFQASDKEFL
ncbi:hypothetical protein [Microbulbifer magnicolonia]|uniref:hypothetical protein n=1 Tax=Microbulbifer magnicolonia TaxID=3109744 RepID=UPI002B40BDCC|nr:hypothetical protein [Microbulbifer sp. GG15]